MTDITEPPPTGPELTLDERFALLGLLTQPYGASNAELEAATGITIGRAERENLVAAGFVDARQDGRTWMHELTDHGWRRAEEELASGAPEGANEDTRVLYGLMGRFADWMKRSDLHVADIFTLDNAPAAAGVGHDAELRALQARREAGNPISAAAVSGSSQAGTPAASAAVNVEQAADRDFGR